MFLPVLSVHRGVVSQHATRQGMCIPACTLTGSMQGCGQVVWTWGMAGGCKDRRCGQGDEWGQGDVDRGGV